MVDGLVYLFLALYHEEIDGIGLEGLTEMILDGLIDWCILFEAHVVD